MEDCKISPYAPSGGMGYGQMWIAGKAVMHHRVVYCEANKVPLASIADKVVMHKCDNPRCVNPEHLTLGTHKDNSHDRDKKGRAAIGERAGRARLTAAQVLEIRSRRWGTNIELGKEFGVDPSCISDIMTRKSWKHI